MKNAVKVACDVKDHVPLDDLHPFQGELKSLSRDDFDRLRREIVETGIAFPVHVWKKPKDKVFIMGGHQRVRVLKHLRDEEGFEVPAIPVVYVMAKNEAEAKRRVLQDVAQYGRVERQGLYEFVVESKMDPSNLVNSFRIPDIDLKSFQFEFFREPQETQEVSFTAKTGATELDAADFQEFDHKCPRCGFAFDAKKA